MSMGMREPTSTIQHAPAHAPFHTGGWGHVYMVGIGGCGMSGLARFLRSLGAQISGSDVAPSPATESLIADGFDVRFAQDEGEIPDGCDTLIASAAIKPGHAEVMRAEERGLRVMSYAEALGQCMIGRTASPSRARTGNPPPRGCSGTS